MNNDISLFSLVPIQLGDWAKIGGCQGIGMNKSCGHSHLLQKRVCEDGTVEKCESHELVRNVSCDGTDDALPHCEKVLTDWKTINTCVAHGLNSSCGPGFTIQERECTHGTINKCLESELTRNISCHRADIPLPDCKRILGPWIIVANCSANGTDKSCGPGTTLMIRNCTNGTKNLCNNVNTEKNISCQAAKIPLPDCKGSV